LLQLDSLRHLRSADNLADLYRQLGYPQEQDISANTPDEIGMEGAAAHDALRIYLLVNLQNDTGLLQHIHFETRDLNSATLRRITEGFLKRPGEYLLSFTDAARPFDRLIFVKPRRDAGGVKMSRLTVQPSRPTAHDRSVLNEIELKAGMGALAAHKKQADAFNIERVTKAFYREYHTLFVHTRETIEAQNPNVQIGPLAKNTTADKASLHAFTQRLLGRIIFLYFIQKKGWLNHNADFIPDLYKQATRHDGSNFYRDALEELFFNVLNTPRPGNGSGLGEVPYLNGSLFEREYPLTTTMNLPNGLFDPALDGSILHTLGSYNFTVNESGALEQDVSLDPEMLGKVFENMMEEEEAKKSGTFYTPRSIVQFMVEETLTRYLEDITSIRQARLLPLCADDSEAHDLTLQEASAMITALAKVRVLDPAVGTASMLVGFLNAMIRVRRSAEAKRGVLVGEGSPALAQWKREYIQHCLYGVDIKHEAIEIARLRLWLSLVVDAQEAEPLPNLDYKLMAGDGLLETVDGTPFIKEQGQLLSVVGGADPISAKTSEIEREHKHFFDEKNPAQRHEQRERIQQLERELFKLDIDARTHKFDHELTDLRRQIADHRQSETAKKRLLTRHADLAENLRRLIEQKVKVWDDKEPLPFFLHNIHFAEVMKGTDERPVQGFDIVIGNPPYVSIGNMESSHKNALKTAFPDVASGRADLYVYFYQKGLNLLREGGRLAYITPNKFMRAGYGEKLRGVLSSKTRLEMLADFGNLPVFDAILSPFIVMMQNAQPDGGAVQMLSERTLKTRLSAELERGLSGVREGLGSFHTYARDLMTPLATSELGLREWNLDDPDVLRLMKRLRKVGKTLGEVVEGKFYRGIVTGLNKAFVIGEVERDELIAADPKSEEVIKPLIGGREIRDGKINWRRKYIILANRGFDISTYSAIYRHLEKYREQLSKRATVGVHKWYELQQPQESYQNNMIAPKIVYPDMSPRFNFVFDEDGNFLSNTAYFMNIKERWLASILCSSVIFSFFISISNRLESGSFRFFTQYMEQLPIVTPTPEQALMLESFADDSRLDELNALVYEMYGLTPAEIELVERLTVGAYAAGEADAEAMEDEDAEVVADTAKSESLKQLVEQIEQAGQPAVMLPEFQRDFVWEMQQTYDLFDSLIKNIFVGSIIYGKPSFGMTLRDIDVRPRKGRGTRARITRRSFTDEQIKTASAVHSLKIVLDGQQRTTSLYRALRGIDRVYFVVKPDVLTTEIRTETLEGLMHAEHGVTGEDMETCISVPLHFAYSYMIDAPFDEEVQDYFEKQTAYGRQLVQLGDLETVREGFKIFRQVLSKFKTMFEQPQLLSYYLLDMSLEKFTTFFERSNSRGIQLNFTDILAAKVFGQFNLRQAFDDFADAYPGVPVNRELLVRAVAVLSGRVSKIDKATVLKELTAADFTTHWKDATRLYVRVLEYLHGQRLMVAIRWLPYENMIVPLMALFHALESKTQSSMTQAQQEFVHWWYWASVFSQRYATASNEVTLQDAQAMQRIARVERLESTYFARFRLAIDEPADLLSYSRSGSAIYRGVLNLLHYTSGGLRDWTNNGPISTGQLGVQDLQDHHYFPKGFLSKSAAKQDIDAGEIESIRDSVLNRVLMPKDTNLKISAQMPHDYLKALLTKNTKLRESMASHHVPASLLENEDQSYRFQAVLLERGEVVVRLLHGETTGKAAVIRAAWGPSSS
jgi:adenine-specific DNA-methyltransferase